MIGFAVEVYTMPKPIWVRWAGSACLTALAIALTLHATMTIFGSSGKPAEVMVACYIAALGWAALWCLGTALHRSRVHRAEINARAMQAAARRQTGA